MWGHQFPYIYKKKPKDYNDQLKNINDILKNKYGLYHNDLKPSNICIDHNNNVKIIDFDHINQEKGTTIHGERACRRITKNQPIFKQFLNNK